DQVFGGEARLIADGEHAADRQRAIAEEEVERERPALADEGDAALDASADQLIGPERRAVEEVDEAVAVGTEKRQPPGAREQLAREALAVQIGRASCRERG